MIHAYHTVNMAKIQEEYFSYIFDIIFFTNRVYIKTDRNIFCSVLQAYSTASVFMLQLTVKISPVNRMTAIL